MSGINGDWYEALKGEFKKPYYKTLFNTVNEEYRTRQIFPPANDIFNAFHLTPLKDVKVVILGQDPYHNFNQAHGLCFSVKKGVQVPPSLVNIYKELQDDLGCTIPNHGCLTKWAEQGVLMLNTVLTVRAHQANSHRGIGWEEFTDAAIMAVNAQDRPVLVEKQTIQYDLSPRHEARSESPETLEALHRQDPAWTHIICRCEKISEAEIVEAVRKGHTTVDGVKFYTRAGMGRCQGGFCSAKIMKIISRESGIPMEELTKRGRDSRLLAGKLGELEVKA